jgi:chromosome partitioning protein
MQTVTFLNQKGGVGKSSCTHHLGGALALSGRRVLVVDADPQGSLTQGLFGPEAIHTIDPAEGIAGVLRGDDPFPASVVRPTGVAGLDLMPGGPASQKANVLEPWTQDCTAQLRLASVLSELAPRYDICLIDCPPTFCGCSWAALAASDALVVPLQPEDYGAQGISAVQGCLADVQQVINPRLRLAGYLITMWNARLTLHQLYDELLRSTYGADVFETRVPYAADFKEAISKRQPIGVYKPKGASAKVIKALADELLQRLDRASGEEAA